MVGSDWEVEYLSPAAGKQITLPGELNDRVTAPHEEAVAGVGQGPWVVGSGRIVEKLQAALVAAVGPVEKQPLIAVCHGNRLEEHEVGREVDAPVRVPRRLVDVDDARLRLQSRIHTEVHAAGDPLVGTRAGEALTAGKGGALDHRQLEAIGHWFRALLVAGHARSPTVSAAVAGTGEQVMIGHRRPDTHSCADALQTCMLARWSR